MCHHYRSAKSLPEHFVEEYHFSADMRKYYADIVRSLKDGDAWPLSIVPALRLDDAGEMEVFAAEWGLLPRWWRPSDKQPQRKPFQRKTINARSETAASKPTFRDAMKTRRCLIPLTEFHENGYYFGIHQGDEFQPLAFAGLWESWQGDEAEVLSVTFLTTEPNREVASVDHDRMPLLLDTAEVRRHWLVDGALSANDPLLRPFPDGHLSVRPREPTPPPHAQGRLF